MDRREIRTARQILPPMLLFDIMERDGGGGLSLQQDLSDIVIAWLHEYRTSGSPTASWGHSDYTSRRRFPACQPAPVPHVVSDLERGFVDEEDAFLHEVQQPALRLVHAPHEREPARRPEVARRVELHAADELEELGDELVALVAHFGLQFALVPLAQHALRSIRGATPTSLRLRESE